MTTTAYSALSQMIRADLGLSEDSPVFIAGQALIGSAKGNLVGVAGVQGSIIAVFDADQLSIRDMEQHISALKEFPAARFYVCRDGRAKRCDSHVFFQEMWLRVVENAGKKHV